MLHQLVLRCQNFVTLGCFHALVIETLLPRLFDLVDTLHRLESGDHQVTIVTSRNVSPLFELEDRIIGHLFAMRNAISLGPLELPRILLALEQLVALA